MCEIHQYFDLDREAIFLKCLGRAHRDCVNSYVDKIIGDLSDSCSIPFDDHNYVPTMATLPRRFLCNFIYKFVIWLDAGGIIQPSYVISAAAFIHDWARTSDELSGIRAGIVSKLNMNKVRRISQNSLLIRAPFIAALSHKNITRIVQLNNRYMINWMFTNRLATSQQLLNVALNEYMGYDALREIVRILRERGADLSSYTYIFDKYVEQDDVPVIELLLMFFLQKNIKVPQSVAQYGFYSANYDLFGAVSSQYNLMQAEFEQLFEHHSKKNHVYHIAHFLRNMWLPPHISIDANTDVEMVDLFIKYIPKLVTEEHIRILKSRDMYKQIHLLIFEQINHTA